MPAFDQMFRTMIAQMRGLSATARMLVGSLAIIVVMALSLVALYAGRSEMAALGLAGADPEVRAQTVSWLDARSIPWSEDRGDLYVPVERKYAVLAQLTEENVVSAEQIDFGSIMQDVSPFTDRATRRTRYLVAKMSEVSRMIGAMSGIERANVVIDQPERSGGLGSSRIPPTASVTVQTRAEPLGQAQADAIARLVAGAHAELRAANVTVVDVRSGRALRARSDDDAAVGRHLELKRSAEKHVRRKLDEFLAYIPGVRVAVNAQVDGGRVYMQRVGVEEPKVGLERERTRESSATNAAPVGEPGLRSNAGLDLSSAGARTSSTTETESDTRMQPAFPTTESRIERDRGYAMKINATVLVPRSWVEQVYADESGESAEPDAAALEAFAEREIERIREQVTPLVDTEVAEGAVAGTVVVGTFADVAVGGLGLIGGGAMAGGGDAAGGLLGGGIVTSVGLGALALVSLLLMFMMVRRATREEDLPTAAELVGMPPALAGGEDDLVGEAGETTAAMVGVEIGEEDVRRQQMIDQINDLARDSSDEAASLLRKWMKVDD